MFFSKDLHGRNPFDVVISSQDFQRLKFFLDFILNNYKITEIDNIGECFRSDFFVQMLASHEYTSESINDFLDYLFSKPPSFPDQLIYKALKEPYLGLTEKSDLNEQDLKDLLLKNPSQLNNESSVKQQILGKMLYFPSLLNSGDSKTLEIFKMISSLEPSNPIFRNNTIIKILEFKWDSYGRKEFFSNAVLFCLFLIIYLLNANYFLVLRLEDEEKNVDSINYLVSLSLDCLIICFVLKHTYDEIIQMRALTIQYYLKSLWNHIDLIVIVLSLTTTILDIFSCTEIFENKDILKEMHSITILLTFLRVLSFARGIEGTCFVINLVTQVLKDIKYFLFFTIFFIVSMSCSGKLKFFSVLIYFSQFSFCKWTFPMIISIVFSCSTEK